MKVTKVKVYDLKESIEASKYPMAVDIDVCTDEITDTTIRLGNSPRGSAHDNFLHGIRVAFDLTFTNKAWVEAERYHFFDIVSSQSTMHRISKFDLTKQYNEYVDSRIISIMNELKDKYNQSNDKNDYLRLLYSNPCGFELTARITTNYGQLKTIYNQRKKHRLPEWREFCDWIITLPEFVKLTGVGV
jgi:hypothetical protein